MEINREEIRKMVKTGDVDPFSFMPPQVKEQYENERQWCAATLNMLEPLLKPEVKAELRKKYSCLTDVPMGLSEGAQRVIFFVAQSKTAIDEMHLRLTEPALLATLKGIYPLAYEVKLPLTQEALSAAMDAAIDFAIDKGFETTKETYEGLTTPTASNKERLDKARLDVRQKKYRVR
jgi:hypothetical protein